MRLVDIGPHRAHINLAAADEWQNQARIGQTVHFDSCRETLAGSVLHPSWSGRGITVAQWAVTHALNYSRKLFVIRGSATASRIAVAVSPSGLTNKLAIQYRDASNVLKNLATTASYSANVPYFIVGTFSTQEVAIYVDGVKQGSAADLSATYSATNTYPVALGGLYAGDSTFNGDLGCTVVFGRVLTQKEVQDLYSNFDNLFVLDDFVTVKAPKPTTQEATATIADSAIATSLTATALVTQNATAGIAAPSGAWAPGSTWTEVGTDALPATSYCHPELVFAGKMWVIGGYTGSANSRKVYWSVDGITWTQAGTDALLVGVRRHAAVVHNGRMWISGGDDGATTRKVYYSTDGITWTQAGTDALPVATYGHRMLSYAEKLWVIGGYATSRLRTVYYSTDGITWIEAGTDALPVATETSACASYGGRIWMIGGNTAAGATRKVYATPAPDLLGLDATAATATTIGASATLSTATASALDSSAATFGPSFANAEISSAASESLSATVLHGVESRINIAGFECQDKGYPGEAYQTASSSYMTFETPPWTGGVGKALRIAISSGLVTPNMYFGKLAADGGQSNIDVATVWMKFDFYIRAAPVTATNAEQIASIRHAGGSKLILKLRGDRKIEVWGSGGGTLLFTSVALTLSTKYRIEIKCGTGVSASWELKIDGVEVGSGLANLNVANVQFCVIGKQWNYFSERLDITYDNVAIDEKGYPGDTQISYLAFQGEGNYSGWDAVGDTPKIDCVDDIQHAGPNGETDYISTSTAAAAYTALLHSGAEMGITGQVRSLRVMAWVRKVGTVDSYRVRLRSGSTNSDSDLFTPSISDYHAISKLYMSDPSTGGAWTVSSLDDVEVGVVSGASAVEHRCTAMACLVEYYPLVDQPAAAEITVADAFALGAIASFPGSASGGNYYSGGNPMSRLRRGLGWQE